MCCPSAEEAIFASALDDINARLVALESAWFFCKQVALVIVAWLILQLYAKPLHSDALQTIEQTSGGLIEPSWVPPALIGFSHFYVVPASVVQALSSSLIKFPHSLHTGGPCCPSMFYGEVAR